VNVKRSRQKKNGFLEESFLLILHTIMERARRSDDREKPQISNGLVVLVRAVGKINGGMPTCCYTHFPQTQVGLKLAKNV
jgi:hypothetical protein